MLDDFMDKQFPGLPLRKPLFYSWDIGIRFELGDPELDMSQKERYLREAGDRAIHLYRLLHREDDELLVVTNAHFLDRPRRHERKLNVYRRRVKDHRVLRKLSQVAIPYIYAEGEKDENIETHRFVLECRGRVLRAEHLIRSLCNTDMGVKPSIEHEVYIINQTTGTIFHVYDDRGCDVIANSEDALREVYTACNNWILEYDRQRIEVVFAQNLREPQPD
ncbi:DUF3885 domain-containing protein [Saccharibacillus sacchari]|uniref:DUF3885 domain-containing protein n=1 Tax=Saccharibacillus sacchari TaxID=456493 RepID=UPI0004B3C7AC|nr:DUF3885 domain-containing protein [Saccharibacillus sacchari]